MLQTIFFLTFGPKLTCTFLVRCYDDQHGLTWLVRGEGAEEVQTEDRFGFRPAVEGGYRREVE